MAPSDSLFLLIKAMSKAEKRHFKLSMSGYQTNGEKHYLRLFDVIEAQQVYDEKAIKKKFRDEPYFRQLARVKIYLHQQILKSLRSLHDDLSADMRLNNYLSEIEILYKKELLRDCAATIKKAKAYAEKYERFPRLLELLAWEAKVTTQMIDVPNLDSMKRKWLAAEKEILEKYNDILDITQLSHDVISFVMKKGEGRTGEDKAFLNKVLENKLMQRKAASFQAELERQIVVTLCLMNPERQQERYRSIEDILSFIESHPHQMAEHINLYVGYSIELTILSLNTRKFLTAQRLIAKLRSMVEKYENEINIRNKLGILHVETDLLLQQGNFKAALAILDKMDELTGPNYDLNPIGAIFIYHMKMNVYFRNRDYKNAQLYIQKIINLNSEVREDFQSTARFVNLILQYEQEEYEHLRYVLRSTYRFLVKKQRVYPPEVIVMDFIKKALKFTSNKQLPEALAELKTAITGYSKEPFMMDFPLTEWIDSKLQKKELREIIKINYQQAVSNQT
jgi:tetratricopeptide (TPR) repeat protein